MDGTKQTTNWIIAGLVALVVIIGGGWLIARERSGTMADANATSTESTSTGVTGETAGLQKINPAPKSAGKTAAAPNPTSMASGETVAVSDQPEGSSVTISDVSITKPTWIAVRDARPWYLGAKLLTSSQKDLTIPLLRNTTAGQSYEVVLFVDNGDGKFSIHGDDTLVTGADGAPVSSTFKAQ